MQPSRRQLLAAIGGCASLGLAGCVADSLGNEESDEAEGFPGPRVDAENATPATGPNADPTFPTEGPLRARLVGPEEGAEYPLFDRSDVTEVSEVTADGRRYTVGVTTAEERAAAIVEAVQDAELDDNYGAYAIAVIVDGERILRSQISPGLAHEWVRGDWDRRIQIEAVTEARAERLREALV